MANIIGKKTMKNANFTRVRRLLIAALMLCFAASAFAYPFSQDDIKQLLVEEARYQKISPSLVLAIAKVESDFNPSALSHAGAKGVMQIMPATAKNGFQVDSHELFNARVNIRVGVAFIKQLIEQYDGEVDIALSHYNGGSRVRRPNGELGVIPATRAYVNKVQMYAQRYQNKGFDEGSGFAESGTLAHRQSKKRLSLSYAQQMALDELDYRDMAMQSVASMMEEEASLLEKGAPLLKKESSVLAIGTSGLNPRINQLQDLRVHNLTRLLPTKKTRAKSNTSYAMSNTASADQETKVVSLSFIRGPKPSSTATLVAKADMQQPLAYLTPIALPRADLHRDELPLSDLSLVNLRRAYDRPPAYDRPTKTVPLRHAGNKQKEVASWEAIFN
jgi:hypothetical protein